MSADRAGMPASRQVDAKYVGRARSMFRMIRDLADIYDDKAELAAMNRGKRGRPYRYTHGLMAAISINRSSLNLDFRSCEGMLPEGSGPEYTTIFRRINAQDASIRESLSDLSCGDVAIHLVPDGTGLTPAARGSSHGDGQLAAPAPRGAGIRGANLHPVLLAPLQAGDVIRGGSREGVAGRVGPRLERLS